MIRLLFVVFVTLGGFAAAALWNARGGDAGAIVEEVFSEGAGAAAAVQTEAKRLGLDVAALLRDPHATGGEDSSRANDSGSGEDVVSDAAESAAAPPNPTGDGAPIEARDLAPRGEFALDTGEPSDAPEDGPFADAADDLEGGTGFGFASPAGVRDPDESAALIRRMLAVYHRTGERE
jgi:hypothetical protein